MKISLTLFFLTAQFALLSAQQWVPQESNTERDLNAVFFVDPDTGWAVGEFNTILSTTDGGDNWVSRGPNVGITAWKDLYFLSGQRGFLVGDGGLILSTTDGGANFSPVPSPTEFNLEGLTFTSPDSAWAVGELETVIFSDDGGESWIIPGPFLQLGEQTLRDVFFIDSGHGWIVGDNGFFLRTTDGGAQWNQALTLPQRDYRAVAFADRLNGWMVTAQGEVLVTNDGGRNWGFQDPGTTEPLNDLAVTSQEVVWVVGNNGQVARTSDGGESWDREDIPFSSNNLRSAFFRGPDDGWVCGEGGEMQARVFATSSREPSGIEGLQWESIFPNPAGASIRLQLALEEGRDLQIQLFNSTGQYLGTRWSGRLPAGRQDLQLKLGQLPSGLYQLRLLDQSGWLSRPLLVR